MSYCFIRQTSTSQSTKKIVRALEVAYTSKVVCDIVMQIGYEPKLKCSIEKM